MILKIILLTIQVICLLIWGFSIILGAQWLPEMIKNKIGGRLCIWWMTVFIVMIATFRLALSCQINLSILTLLVGTISLLLDVYILWGVLATTGIIHFDDENIRFPLIRMFAVYFVFLLILKYIA